MGSVPPKCYYLQMLSSKPRITIVHGWGDDVSQGWIAWLVTQLRAEGYDAVAPQFPRERLAKTDFHTWCADQLHVSRQTFKIWYYTISYGGRIDPWVELLVIQTVGEYEGRSGL